MVLSELVSVFVIVLAVITGLMLMIVIGKEAVDQGLGVVQVLRMLPYALPEALRFAVPGTVLFAACTVYGRMAGANEVVAIKSLGISPMQILWPSLVFAVGVSFATVWLNDLAVSWGRTGIQRVVLESLEEIAYGMLRTKRTFESKKLSMNVREVQGRRLLKPVLSFQPTGDHPAVNVSAEEAELHADPEQNTLTIVLYNSVIDIEGEAHLEDPGRIERQIPLNEMASGDGRSTSPSYLPLHTFARETVEQKRTIQRLEAELAMSAGYQVLTGDFANLTGVAWKNLRLKLIDAKNRLFRLQCEPHRRWANGFSCLCFVLVGAPLAIRLKHADFLTIFFLCFMTILLVYYPLMIFGVDRAKSGTLPPYFVWFGNGLMVLWGLWLLRRVVRY
jgi:lipopolysaccharide export system permease protein